jgi:phosphate transport system protein
MAGEHTVRAFDAELAELAGDVARLGGLAASLVADGATALTSRNSRLAEEVVERDRTVDDLQASIEHKAIRMMALRQPVAIDLRRAVAAIKMAYNLERCGDLAKNIAKRAIIVSETDLPAALIRPLGRMGKLVLKRLNMALDAYARDDLIHATEVWALDREVDEQYDSVVRELLTYMMGDARLITACTHLLFVAKNLERIGDHATNIAELVHYELTGEQLKLRPTFDATP